LALDLLLVSNKHDMVFCEAILMQYFWKPQQQQVQHQHQDALVHSLVYFISQHHDIEACLAALEIANLLLRIIPESRKTWQEAASGVDCLEEVCHRAASASSSSLSEHAAILAADLLDDYFAQHDDDGDDDYYGPAAGQDIAPTIANNQFVFGASVTTTASVPPALHVVAIGTGTGGGDGNNAAAMATASTSAAGQGRGHGRTLPAWMQQQ
jgi:hypothetical protein